MLILRGVMSKEPDFDISVDECHTCRMVKIGKFCGNRNCSKYVDYFGCVSHTTTEVTSLHTVVGSTVCPYAQKLVLQ